MKKIPMRKCVATNEQLTKQELIRVVRSKEGVVSIDPTGKKNGRGAYLKRSKDAFALAKKKGSLKRALNVDIPDSIFEELEQFSND